MKTLRNKSKTTILYYAGFALTVAVLVTSCGREQATTTEESSFAIVKSYPRGPATLTLRVDKETVTIADRVKLELEVVAGEEYEVELPKFGEQLEQFAIIDYQMPQPKLIEDGKVRYVRSYELEPYLSGEYKIPPMTVRFWEKDKQDAKKHEIETEEVVVTVTSLLPEKQAELKIKDLAGPVELPAPDRTWIYATVGGVVVALAAVIFVVRRLRRGEQVVEAMRIPPHELAYQQLERLIAENLIEQGQVKLFYIRVSDVLRHYIENRFALHAPERTTEEFLDELRAAPKLEKRHNTLLGEFLSHCDMVKFAKVEPSNDEIQKTFDACKQFISETTN